MIVGTAGHIDHGKTTLVRALTGVDTHRLKEEKARGISIELGYAYTPLPDGDVLGYIDVPGHEKLVHTMAAGAGGIDFGLLVIAADDGIMPQTREHLAILQLLGVSRGAIAITKVDRVAADRLDTVRQEVLGLVAGTFLGEARVFMVNASSPADLGTRALRAHIEQAAAALPARRASGLFRLAVDRVFTLSGQGTVVTGTVHSGRVQLNSDDGATLVLMPAGTPVRIRSIHAQNRPSPSGQAGQRCALNLAGIDKSAIARGDWIADARCFVPSRHVDVELHMLASADTAATTWLPVHVHLGAAHHMAHIVPLSADSVAPGAVARAQLVFDHPVCAMPGDRYIVRNAQATQTLGGGRVLDPDAPDRRRRTPGRMAWLDAVAAMLDGGGVHALLTQASVGMDDRQLTRLTGRPAEDTSIPEDALWVAANSTHGARTLILRAHWDALRAAVRTALERLHADTPDEPGADAGRLRRIALPALPEAPWQALIADLLQDGTIVRNGPWLHLPGHAVQFDDDETRLAQALLPLLHAGAYDPPWVRDLARMRNEAEDRVRKVLRKLLRRGDVAQVVPDLFYHREKIQELAELFARLARDGTQGAPMGINAACFRDATGLGRKRAIQILEYFDRVGYTRRLRDLHMLRTDGGATGFDRPAASRTI
ncbi:selenocysteine-specific translation elongation factor [Bordetella genomosp. 8]|uniref:Selenocysteine-specific elongation factor n=1 Tax=Bordetella genomosp. 8 TaxID=1416806 RepID=A0A1W6YP40_9BORD|nr:selenocysteine-specific translation elongation factor [Bordetella genomosp. 8]ARP82774.1 selenocysteine-specific translation elongation factor [Bordetella genomosp. 8]